MGVLTDFFRATEAELRATFSTWKVPLDVPVRKMAVNPFTRQPTEVLCWDPRPEEVVEDGGPTPLPFPSIDMKGLGQTSVAQLIALVCGASKEAEERFYRGALLGPEEGPWIHDLPDAFLAKLASMDAAAVERVSARWAEEERADIGSIKDAFTREQMLARCTREHWRSVLDELVAFGRAAVAEGRRMYMWVCL